MTHKEAEEKVKKEIEEITKKYGEDYLTGLETGFAALSINSSATIFKGEVDDRQAAIYAMACFIHLLIKNGNIDERVLMDRYVALVMSLEKDGFTGFWSDKQ